MEDAASSKGMVERVIRPSRSSDNLMRGMRQIVASEQEPLAVMRDTCALAAELFRPLSVGVTTISHGSFIVPCYQNKGHRSPVVLARGDDFRTGLPMYSHSISESVRRENAVTLWTKEEARGLFNRVPSPNVEGAASLVGIPWFTEGDRLGGTIVMWFDDTFEPSSEQSTTLPLLGEVFSMALAGVLASRRRAETDERPVLSPREMQVLMLVCEGMANKEISTALGIGQNTVKEYVSGAMRKLGVKNRTEAAVKASRIGIVQQ